MSKKIFLSITSLILALSLCGCNYVGGGISSMVKPPEFSTQQTLIYKALEESIQEGDKISLVSPQNGAYRSAVIIHDMDNKPDQNAIVFYESKVESTLGESGLRVCLLDRIDGKWKAIWDVPAEGAKVDKVLFLKDDIKKDEYVVIGYIPENKGQNTFCIYSFKDGSFSRVESGSYQMMELYDITGDGLDEFITVGYKDEGTDVNAQNLSSLTTTASVYKMENGSLNMMSQTRMSGKAVRYENITKDDTTFDKHALIIDEQINKNTYATEILTYDVDGLTNLILEGSESLFEQTMRTQIPISYDIDGDGKIEIPKVTLFPGYTQNSNSPVYMSTWRKLQDGRLTGGVNAYVNYSQGYGLILPDSWVGVVSAKNVVQNNEIEFFKYNGNIDDDKEKILDIKIEALGNQKNYPVGYTIIDTVGQLVFMARTFDIKDRDLNIGVDQVKDKLVKMYITSD